MLCAARELLQALNRQVCTAGAALLPQDPAGAGVEAASVARRHVDVAKAMGFRYWVVSTQAHRPPPWRAMQVRATKRGTKRIFSSLLEILLPSAMTSPPWTQREADKAVVQPVPGEAARPVDALRLRALVFVVREARIDAAAVQVEARAQVLLRHRRALDVPAWPAGPTAGHRRLAGQASFHRGKSAGSRLSASISLRAPERSSSRGAWTAHRNNKLAHAEVNAVGGGVATPRAMSFADLVEHLGDVARWRGSDPSAGRAGVVSVWYSAVQRSAARRRRGQGRRLLGPGAVYDLVIDIGDVAYEDVTLPSRPKVTNHDIKGDQRPHCRVKQVGRPSGPADITPCRFARTDRRQARPCAAAGCHRP